MTFPLRFIGLRCKILAGFTLIFTVVFTLAFSLFYWYSVQEAMGKIRTDLLDTIRGAVLGIDGEEFARLAAQTTLTQGSPASSIYLRQQEWLKRIHEIEPHANPYTFVSAGQGKDVLWIGDSFRITHPDRATKFKERYDASKSKLYGGLRELTLNMTPYRDQWGSWVSAYQPILDREGKVVGALGIDFNAEYVEDVQDGIRRTMAGAFLLTYLALFGLVYVLSSMLTRPLTRLIGSVQRVAKGDYDQGFAPFLVRTPHDEIDILGRAFGQMVEQVRQREQRLQNTVQALTIEIDQTRKAQQVKEIVDTETFRDLKYKAQQMRKRAHQSAETPKDTDVVVS